MTIIDEDMRKFLQNFASAAHTSNSVDPGQVLEDTLKRAQLAMSREGKTFMRRGHPQARSRVNALPN